MEWQFEHDRVGGNCVIRAGNGSVEGKKLLRTSKPHPQITAWRQFLCLERWYLRDT